MLDKLFLNKINKLQKIKELSLQEISIKCIEKVAKKFICLFRKVKLQIKPIDIDNKYFNEFSSNCEFLFDDKIKSIYICEVSSSKLEKDIILEADKICEHIFNLLGSGEVELGKNIPWNEDFKVGFKWKNRFYHDIKIIDLSNNSDVKVPWELSRFQHIPLLGKAYWLKKDTKYEIEFKEQIEDWVKNNPVEMSVNWTCTMDVAIRAVNWILGYFFFKDSELLSKDFWNKFNKCLYLHGRFIIKNLENKGKYTGNHYLSNIVGLVWLGLYFGDFVINDNCRQNCPKTWLDFSLKELEKEMFVQVNKDGTNYEASTSYHRLVTELFLITTILCDRNQIKFSSQYIERLEKMCDFIMNITKSNGLAPLIGDADDGRLVILSNYYNWEKNDFTHILALAGLYFNRDDFKYYGRNYLEDSLLIFGEICKEIKKPKKLISKAYRDGGYYILRNERCYCIIRCGELSFRGDGVHSHNDQLSFELNIDGKDFFVDPGVYVYTADYNKRNLYRSTEMHNTLVIDGYEQNNFDKYNLFYMREETFAECVEFSENKFVGRHFGYKHKCSVIHTRTICIYEKSIEIIDCVGDNIDYKVKYILDSKVRFKDSKESIVLNNDNVSVKFNFDGIVNYEDCKISKGYGIIEDTRKLSVQCNGHNCVKIIM